MAFAVSQTKLKSVTHLAILDILYMDIISLSTHTNTFRLFITRS